jgi:uncharacterized protein YodC (DUF2158 family)
MQFEIGDTVYLKSGSPRMTVTGVDCTFITVHWIVFESADIRTLTAPAAAFDLHKKSTKEGSNT